MEEIEDIVKRAKIFATERHAGQTRKDSRTPYIVHPAMMVASLKQCGIDDPYILAAAWLHDTVEDTNTTLDEIYGEFGPSVCGLVDALTRRKPHENHDLYNSRVLSSSHAARLIKVADTEHNIRTIECLDDQAQERKLREAKDIYLLMREELCQVYDAKPLFDKLEDHVSKLEGTTQDGSDDSYDAYDYNEGYVQPQPWWYGGGTDNFDKEAYEKARNKWLMSIGKAPKWMYEQAYKEYLEREGKLESMCEDEKEETRTYVVIRKNWIESERGWGQKPDGYSLHLTEEDMKEFIREHWAEWPDKVPDWYYGPDIMSSPRPFEVDEKTYNEIKESEHGIKRC